MHKVSRCWCNFVSIFFIRCLGSAPVGIVGSLLSISNESETRRDRYTHRTSRCIAVLSVHMSNSDVALEGRERGKHSKQRKKIPNAREWGIFIVAAIPSYRTLYIYNVVAPHTLPAFGDKYFEFIFRFLHEQRVQHGAVCLCVSVAANANFYYRRKCLPSTAYCCRESHTSRSLLCMHANPRACVCIRARDCTRVYLYRTRYSVAALMTREPFQFNSQNKTEWSRANERRRKAATGKQ